MPDGLFRACAPDRFVWHELGQPDAPEVVVFDEHEALTHLIDGLALDVHQLLLARPSGLSVAELNALMRDGLEPAQAQEQELQASETLPALEQLLTVMQAIGLVHRS